jgi:conjugative transfer pilus assembly protein TraH
MKTKIIVLHLLLFTPLASANMNEKLGAFFNAVGTSSNITEGGAYKDQSAGYYSGGGVYARNTVQNTQLANITLPGYRAGCSGIDMHFGAMSFISSEKLVQAFRNIGSNMGSYAFQLALETMSPSIKNIMSELNDLAQKINMANLNSCEAAATTLGAILPQSDVANKQLCTMIGTSGGYGGFSDYAAARQGCGAEGKRGAVLDAGKNDARFKKMLGTEFNLAWESIKENAFLVSDKDLAELFMTVSGTIISKNDGDNYIISSKPSQAPKETLLSTLMNGGTAKIFSCGSNSNNKCLDIVDKEMTISPDKGFVSRVKVVLEGIQQKIYNDEPLNASEKAFLNSTRLPFYKILNVTTAQRRGMNSAIDIQEYSELGAIDILYQFLIEILDVMSESAAHLKSSQIDDTQMREFQKGLSDARLRVSAKRNESFKLVEQQINMIQKTELIEKSIHAKLNALAEGGL